MVCMLKREVLPAALRFQGELGDAVEATMDTGVQCPDSKAELKEVVRLISQLRIAIRKVERAEAEPAGNGQEHARHICGKLLPAMAEARRIADTLEQMIPDDLWPLPRYSEMLFVK